MAHFLFSNSVFLMAFTLSLACYVFAGPLETAEQQKGVEQARIQVARILTSKLALADSAAHDVGTDLSIRQPSCIAEAEFQKCVSDCAGLQTGSSLCKGSDCCVSVKGNVVTMCSKNCCVAVDANGKFVTPDEKCSVGGGGKCFASDGIVELEDGSQKTMSELNLGDRVQVGPQQYSPVFMFTHRNPRARTTFVSIRTTSGQTISLSHGHFIYLNGGLASSSSAKVGDEVMLANGDSTTVDFVKDDVKIGLYNPQTLHGDVVVNGIVASTYTTAVSPTFAHAWLTPLRLMYKRFGVTGAVLEDGSDFAVDVLPHGAAMC